MSPMDPGVARATVARGLRLTVGLLGLVALALLGRALGAQVPVFAARVQSFGALGPLVFIVAYMLAAVALVPGVLLTLAAGAVFGLVRGSLYVVVGATLGATAAFLVARYVARGMVERHLAGNARFAALDRAIGADGRRIVTLLRLSPVFPFTLLNYALGLTRVRLRDYVSASIGMVPGTVLYVYYGKVAGDVASLAAGVPQARDAGYYLVLGVGLATTVVVTVMVTRLARNALRDLGGP